VAKLASHRHLHGQVCRTQAAEIIPTICHCRDLPKLQLASDYLDEKLRGSYR
jgi:hypothetical protein